MVNWTLRYKLQRNFNQNSYIFIQENPLENVVWKMVSILSRPQWVNTRLVTCYQITHMWYWCCSHMLPNVCTAFRCINDYCMSQRWCTQPQCSAVLWWHGPWFKIKMPSYQYRKSHCGAETVERSSYLHNGISYTGKMASLYWTNPI